MNAKTLIGSAMAVALVGVGVLAGSVAGNGSASAQTPSPSAPSTTNPTSPTTPPTDMPGGIPGMHGGFGGPGGMRGGSGDFGGGPGGQGATADGASKVITNTSSFITLVKSDLAYATGKMDTTSVQKWVNG